MSYSIPLPIVRGVTRTVIAVSVLEPESNDAVVATYELLCDDYGQETGDEFLSVMENVARRRGLVDDSGRRTRRSTSLSRTTKRSVPSRTGRLRSSLR